jgi:hypothetical protein
MHRNSRDRSTRVSPVNLLSVGYVVKNICNSIYKRPLDLFKAKLVFATVFAQNAEIDSDAEMKQKEVRETTAESEGKENEFTTLCAAKHAVFFMIF